MQGRVLSNVIGAPFDPYIIKQLNVRSVNNSSLERDNKQILYLANKMSWTRLTSSVRVFPQDDAGKPLDLKTFYQNLFDGEIPYGDYSKPESLARNWVLQSGVISVDDGEFALKRGLGPNGAYGLGGVRQQGFRPMPGIESATIDTKGTLGSLREATISFKLWNVVQLNVMEALYFRLGYTMFLEWGHVNYFDNNGTFVTNPYGIDIFDPSLTSKEDIQHAVTAKNKQSSGNYDAMFGVVTNYYFSFNQEGGFDCNLKLIGLGAIIDTVRINQTFKLPEILEQKIKTAQDTINQKKEEEAKRIEGDERSRLGLPVALPNLPKNYADIVKLYEFDPNRKLTDPNTIVFPKTTIKAVGVTNTAVDYFFKAATGTYSQDGVDELNRERMGLFINKGSSIQLLPALDPNPVVISTEDINFFSSRGRSGISTAGALEGNFVIQDLATKAGFREGSVTELGTDADRIPVRNNAVAIFDSELINQFGTDKTAIISKPVAVNIPYVTKVQLPGSTTVKDVQFVVQIAYKGGKLTRDLVLFYLDQWWTNDKSIVVNELDEFTASDGSKNIKIVGTPNGLPDFTISFNDPGLITQILPRPEKQEVAAAPGTKVDPTGDTEGGQNGASTGQTQEAQQYISALHAMLITVLSEGTTAAYTSKKEIVEISLKETTRLFYNSGVFKNVLETAPVSNLFNNVDLFNIGPARLEIPKFNVTDYAIKGFNSNVMADKNLYNSITNVNFDKLCTAYIAKYAFTEENTKNPTTPAQYPVYIKLGYLLAFLNNMGLIYEAPDRQASSNNIRPYFYIDFHPDYNFCLTSPKHFTVDPSICLIPMQATDEDYLGVFPGEVTGSLKQDAFKPSKENTYSAYISPFKTDNAYQGRTMEILLNVQYLLDTATQFLKNDPDNGVYLQPYLEQILKDINKATGGFNLFRVAYRDDSNTVIIKDDQWVPNLEQEPTALNGGAQYEASKSDIQLPVFGAGSIVKEMEFKTNMNTKMSAMIAISAQSSKQVVNSIDGSPIGTYNQNYKDAFLPVKLNSEVSGSSGKSNKEAEQKKRDVDLEAAQKFNDYVKQVYSTGKVSKYDTSSAVSYYLNRLRTSKGEEEKTKAAPFIPANLSLSIDGISGILMGNVFTIPENRLPASLRGTNLVTKVGFTVVGLTQTLEGNEWTTKIRGQMIRMREDLTPITTATIGGGPNIEQVKIVSSGAIGKCQTLGCPRRSGNSFTSAELYQNPQFRAKVDALTKKYQLTDSTALYKVMYAESKMRAQSPKPSTGAVGLIQFVPSTAADLGTTTDIIERTDGIGQLKFVEQYLDKQPGIRGGGIYELYSAVFFPIALPRLKDPNWIIQGKGGLTPYKISYQNPAIACAAGKQPGEPLNISDFKKYVDCIS